jgi:phosphotransferase family enzyme
MTEVAEFPPSAGYIKVPLDSRRDADAALCLYAPCVWRAALLQSGARWVVRTLGPRWLPLQRAQWRAPMGESGWRALLEQWRAIVGTFDSLVVCERAQSERSGFGALLLLRNAPVAFVKLERAADWPFDAAWRAHEASVSRPPSSFTVPAPLGRGNHGDWHFMILEAMPGEAHRPVKEFDMARTVRDVQSVLEHFPSSAGTPSHWLPIHGDFAPWNLRRLAGGRIVLYDWDEVSWGPPGADEIYYSAVAAALWGRPTSSGQHAEAVDFWLRRISERPTAAAGRDRNLRNKLLRSLEEMRRS